mmetsp:Transcript_99123/g.171899  ORF Transcript_99123/g.171899 Transcript_99123/m.171899 type:complete len:200 (+) Transcript_99123:114-713(+)
MGAPPSLSTSTAALNASSKSPAPTSGPRMTSTAAQRLSASVLETSSQRAEFSQSKSTASQTFAVASHNSQSVTVAPFSTVVVGPSSAAAKSNASSQSSQTCFGLAPSKVRPKGFNEPAAKAGEAMERQDTRPTWAFVALSFPSVTCAIHSSSSLRATPYLRQILHAAFRSSCSRPGVSKCAIIKFIFSGGKSSKPLNVR